MERQTEGQTGEHSNTLLRYNQSRSEKNAMRPNAFEMASKRVRELTLDAIEF